ncbi:hypothetical protein [Tenacibaculum sp.]|uniref:hypothetical protein n=1 Tax=Tenacibaculum sp. TaxID=1906242 RepID=UPI003D126E67
MKKKETYCRAINDKNIKRKPTWFLNILIAFDQLGNAFAKGNPDNTISARIGFFMHHEEGDPSKFWELLESVVNFTFKPIDGIEHCFVAYCHDKNEVYQKADIVSKIILFIFVVVFCVSFLIVIVRIVAFIFPGVKSQYEENGKEISLKTINILRKEHCSEY